MTYTVSSGTLNSTTPYHYYRRNRACILAQFDKLFMDALCACRCNEGYEAAYCQVAATSTTELPLLISLSTLLPVAAILVLVVVIVIVYRRLNEQPDVTSSRQRRDNIRTT